MSVSAMTAAMYHSQSKYATRLVLIAVANFDNPQGSFASVDTLGRLAGGLNRRTVQRALDELVELKEIKEIVRPGQTTLYRVEISCPDDCDRSPAHRQISNEKEGGGLQTTGGVQTTPGGGLQTTGGAVSRPPEPNTNSNINSNSFDEFWKAYPKKTDKGAARRAFTTAIKKVDFDNLLKAVQSYSASVSNTEKRYIKNPATWLNAEAWDNETQETKETKGSIWDSIQ